MFHVEKFMFHAESGFLSRIFDRLNTYESNTCVA